MNLVKTQDLELFAYSLEDNEFERIFNRKKKTRYTVETWVKLHAPSAVRSHTNKREVTMLAIIKGRYRALQQGRACARSQLPI